MVAGSPGQRTRRANQTQPQFVSAALQRNTTAVGLHRRVAVNEQKEGKTMNEERTWIRYAAIAGILFVVLTIVSAAIGGSPPQPGDSVASIRHYASSHRSALLVGIYLS